MNMEAVDFATLREYRDRIRSGEVLPPQQFALYENLEAQAAKGLSE